MIARDLQPPKKSFFLIGPRSTGKSTWLQKNFQEALFFDLLKSDTYFQFLHAPESFREIVSAQPKKRWIVVDEIQRVPQLTQEVHTLIQSERRSFALSGSSARKLKRGQANLLAGRALWLSLYPLTYLEFKNTYSLHEALHYGTLPEVVMDSNHRIGTLEAYAGTYLREEIKEEALIRNLEAFGRFLHIATIANAQITNLSNIGRDSGISRTSVSNYFEILEDTLLGHWLPAWTPRAKIKEVAHPKFYFFDCGVLRSLQGRLRDRPTQEELGHLLETYLFHELQATMAYQNIGGKLYFWRTESGTEVDFIWERGKHRVAIEVKASKNWKSEFTKGLRSLQETKLKPSRSYGIYLGEHKLKKENIFIFPLKDFLNELSQGNIFP